jgi:hypothetical protein
MITVEIAEIENHPLFLIPELNVDGEFEYHTLQSIQFEVSHRGVYHIYWDSLIERLAKTLAKK